MLSKNDQAAVDAFLANGGRVYKARTGESGIYDEFGVPFDLNGKRRGARNQTRERLALLRKLTAEGVPRTEIAEKLGISYESLCKLVHRWAGWGKS